MAREELETHPTKTPQVPGRRFGRRGLLKLLGMGGLGAALARVTRAEADAGAALDQVPGLDAGPATRIRDWDGRRATLTTGPLSAFPAPAGSRVGLCLLVSGAFQGAGRRPLIAAVDSARVSIEGWGNFTPDPGVEQRVYRLLDALSTVRPVELFGLSATVDAGAAEAGTPVETVWEVRLRGGDVAHDRLERYLDRFHACVLGRLAARPAFAGRLSYLEISRRSAAYATGA